MPFLKSLLAALAFVTAAPAFAAQTYGMAGCGVGMTTSPSAIRQSIAATTVALSSQSFAISSGSSGCKASGKKIAEERQREYLAMNLLTLAKEGARGDGEILAGYAATFGCRADAWPAFKSRVRDGYDRIFSAPGVDAILHATRAEVGSAVELAAACEYLL